MENQKCPSLFNLLSGKASFTDEPLWYRLAAILVLVAFWIFVIWVMKGVGLIALLSKGVIGKWGDLEIIKGRAP